MVLSFNIAGLSSEELEHLISERCAAHGTVKRVAICDSYPIVNYKLAFVAMSTPSELATVIKEVGATSIGDAAVIRLDLKPAGRRPKLGDAAVAGVAVIAGVAALFGLYMLAQQRMADAEFAQVFSRLALGQSRQQVEGIAAAGSLGLNSQPAAKPNRVVFAGSCCASLYALTHYELSADYDADGRLVLARLLKSPAAQGVDTGCFILFEIPSLADKTYPYACSADARNP